MTMITKKITTIIIAVAMLSVSAAAQTKTQLKQENSQLKAMIDSLRIEEFLDALCSGGRQVLIYGHIYDIDDEEYRFISHIGNAGFINAKNIDFADELDIEARKEEFE